MQMAQTGQNEGMAGAGLDQAAGDTAASGAAAGMLVIARAAPEIAQSDKAG